MGWLKKLGKDNRGSRPRCVLLTDGSREQVAKRLTRVVDRPEVVVSPKDCWQPRGKSDVREAQLDKESAAALLPQEMRKKLKNWWLVRSASTPHWDIASTCTVSGKPGLLLVEAKAHSKEMLKGEKCSAKEPNRTRIECALTEANAGLGKLTGGSWQLSAWRYYQLSNRFAWSWKLAKLGVPTVLLYIGFLNAQEMRADGGLFQSKNDWRDTLLEHYRDVVHEICWDKTLDVGGTPLVPLIRVFEQPFDPKNPGC